MVFREPVLNPDQPRNFAMATAPMLTSKLWPGTTGCCRNPFPLKSRSPIYCLTLWCEQGVLLSLVDELGP